MEARTPASGEPCRHKCSELTERGVNVNAFLNRLGVKFPIIQAPMAGVSTHAMAAAVSNAGGLGSIGVGNVDAGAARTFEEARAAFQELKLPVYAREAAALASGGPGNGPLPRWTGDPGDNTVRRTLA